MALLDSIGDILGGVSGFSNPYGTPSTGQWNLQRGIYYGQTSGQTMVFFYETKDPIYTQKTAIDQITDAGGRRLARYEYPYRDGQRLADLGRKAEIYSMNVKFHGLNYQAKLNEFLSVVANEGQQASVTHPVRGVINARYVTHEFLHRYDEWNAVTIKVVFEEDNTDQLEEINIPAASSDSALRTALQTLVNTQATISAAISSVGALLLLPSTILNAMQTRLNSLTNQMSQLLGQFGATFSSNTTIQALLAAAQPLALGVSSLTSGTTVAASLPAVYQVGFDPTTQAAIQAQTTAFVNANQITPQQAGYSANQVRSGISAAITEVNTNFGNDGYDIMVSYREMAVAIQTVTEAVLANVQQQVTVYVVQTPMSLRAVAFANGLSTDDQNQIEALNPYLPSVNYLPIGTMVLVPVTP